jgi:hypothetical protein
VVLFGQAGKRFFGIALLGAERLPDWRRQVPACPDREGDPRMAIKGWHDRQYPLSQ